MADNVNIIVQDTINDIVVNAAVVVETIDINVQAAVDVVDIVANPNNYVVNINRIIGEQVQSDWTQTDNQAPDYIKNKPSIPTATSDLTNDGEDGVNPFITAADIPPVTGFVPYTGANANVDLGEYELKVGQVEFDQTPTGTAGVAVMRWNDSDGTVDLGLKGGNVTLQIGQEEVVRVVNKTGGNLLEANYQCVRVRTQAEGGAQGQRLAVKLAQANTKANHTGILGLVTETINNNQEGFITTFGNVNNIDTTGDLQGENWLDGDVIWLSETVAGGLTNVEPTTHPVQIGYVVYAHQNNGKIFVSVSQGVDQLDELHDVSIASVANKDGLFYDSATTTWKNETIASALGYTPQNADLFTRLRNGWEASTDYISAVFNDGWNSRNSGTGSGITSSYFLTGINKNGICLGTTGSTATGYAGPEFGSPNANNGISIGIGELIFEQLVRIPTLSTSTERFVVFEGLIASANFTSPSNGIFFYYDEGGTISSASPNWKCYTSNTLVRTLTTTSIVVNAGQWYKLRAVVNAAATSVSFYIDGTLVATHTTNIPPTTIGYALNTLIQKTVGTTARTLQTDYSAISQTFTTPR